MKVTLHEDYTPSIRLHDNYTDITPKIVLSSVGVKPNGKGTIFVSGPRFAEFRREKRLTQPEFAELLGISEDRVKQLEPKKQSRIYFRTARIMADRLNIDLDELEAKIGPEPTTNLGQAARRIAAARRKDPPGQKRE